MFIPLFWDVHWNFMLPSITMQLNRNLYTLLISHTLDTVLATLSFLM